MDTLDLIISLDKLSFPAALPVFNFKYVEVNQLLRPTLCGVINKLKKPKINCFDV